MLNISCLHSARSDIAVFEAARRTLRFDDVMLKHRVRTDFSGSEGRTIPQTAVKHAAAELFSLSKGAHGLLVSIPSLLSVTGAADILGVPIVHADLALAEAAVSGGGRVTVLCASGSVLASMRALFDNAAIAAGATVEVRLVSGAGDLLGAGREADYLRVIADAAELALDDGTSVVALAQTAMAGAAALVRSSRVVTGPTAGLAAVVRAVQATSNAS